MKAFLLAAGRGSRLRPLTDETPKCLAPIGGVPLLGHWLALLASSGVAQVLINTSHLAGQVKSYVTRWRGPIRIHLVHEHELLGSLGTLLRNRDFLGDESEVLVCYADNLTNVDLRAMVAFHGTHRHPLTLGLFETDRPEECGIAELDEEGTVTRFEEKPARPRTTTANAGIYVADTEMLRALAPPADARRPIDIGHDLLPRWIGRMAGYRIREFLMDVGTPDRLERARKYVSEHAGDFVAIGPSRGAT